jgi:hypothetical protein
LIRYLAIAESDQRAPRKRSQSLVPCKWARRYHRNNVLRFSFLAEADRRLERRAACEPDEMGAAVTIEVSAVAQQHIEGAAFGQHAGELAESAEQRPRRWCGLPAFAQPAHQPAKSMLAVGSTDRLKMYGRPLLDSPELTIVCEGPVAPPEFAREWMGVLEGDAATVRAPYVADHDAAFDRISPNETGDF